MIKGFRVKNLRAIADSGLIRFKKINILVGKNSAGKSTLLRVLPLLRQSVERPTKGPILWYGRLVDFGNYQNAVNSEKKTDGVSFEFSIALKGSVRDSKPSSDDELFIGTETAYFYKDLRRVTATFTVGQDSSDDVGRVRKIFINLGSDTVSVLFSQSLPPVVEVNSKVVKLSSRQQWLVQPGKILPTMYVLKEDSYVENGAEKKYFSMDFRPFLDRMVYSLSSFFHGNTSREKIVEFASSLYYSDEEPFYEQLLVKSNISDYFSYQISLNKSKSYRVAAVREAILLASLSGIFRRIDQELGEFANGVKYVEPLRATAERYYRQQDLAVDEIDSRGENVAMFLSSLQLWERRNLKAWMLKNLGFYADVEQGSGHTQVKIGFEQGVGKNIADLGFGFSQLLPIILMLWRTLVSPPPGIAQNKRPFLAIEQPELHLHPNFQARIADVLVAAVTEVRTGCVFVETHSEHLVNRIGQLIARGVLKKDDVQLLVVEDSGLGLSEVRRVTFDDNGFLDDNWPAGFFTPEST